MKQRKKGHNEKRKSDEAEDTPERERGHLGEFHIHSLSERHVGKENKINRATFCIRLFGVIFGLREIDNTIYSLHRARIEMYTKYALLYTKCSIRDLFHRSPPSHWAPRCSRNPPRSIISHISESSLFYRGQSLYRYPEVRTRAALIEDICCRRRPASSSVPCLSRAGSRIGHCRFPGNRSHPPREADLHRSCPVW